MSDKLILVIGHSHLRALHDARAADRHLCPGIEFAFAPLDGDAFRPAVSGAGLHEALRALLGARRLVAVVLALLGNRHNEIGLARHPVPFDTVVPGAADLPLAEGATLVPHGLVRKILVRRNVEAAMIMAAVRAATPLPVLHVSSPPPIPSEEHLRAHARGYAPRFEATGIAPRALRRKLWLIHSAIYRDLCHRNRIEFLPAPPEMCDADGMLIPEAWPDDPTHGNARYGAAVLAQIARRAETLAPAPARLRRA